MTVKRVDKNVVQQLQLSNNTNCNSSNTNSRTSNITTDIRCKTQTGTPAFTRCNPDVPMDEDVPATFEDGSTTKVIPGEGTHSSSLYGTVTSVLVKNHSGTEQA